MNTKESFAAHGENLLKKVRELIDEGNIRKITITDKAGKELMTFPLTVGVVGALLAPVLAAIGAMAAMIGECTITVEREETKKEEQEFHSTSEEVPMTVEEANNIFKSETTEDAPIDVDLLTVKLDDGRGWQYYGLGGGGTIFRASC